MDMSEFFNKIKQKLVEQEGYKPATSQAELDEQVRQLAESAARVSGNGTTPEATPVREDTSAEQKRIRERLATMNQPTPAANGEVVHGVDTDKKTRR
jgi:hypothetical protein